MLGQLKPSADKPSMYSPLTLAYLGDSVFELYIRYHLLSGGNTPCGKLHRIATHYVSAEAQSSFMAILEPLLTEEEEAIYKRGRNAKSCTVPKHADIIDYKRATGLEALIGYLYLCGRKDRIDEIISMLLKDEI